MAHQRATNRQHLLLTARKRPSELRATGLEHGKQFEDVLDVALDILHIVPLHRTESQIFGDSEAAEQVPTFRTVCNSESDDFVRREAL